MRAGQAVLESSCCVTSICLQGRIGRSASTGPAGTSQVCIKASLILRQLAAGSSRCSGPGRALTFHLWGPTYFSSVGAFKRLSTCPCSQSALTSPSVAAGSRTGLGICRALAHVSRAFSVSQLVVSPQLPYLQAAAQARRLDRDTYKRLNLGLVSSGVLLLIFTWKMPNILSQAYQRWAALSARS